MEIQPPVRYVIITPARDEAKYIEATIKSVVSQTILPVEWVIVDDGSTDGTGEIIARYAKEHCWILPVRRADRGFRDADIGAIGAFVDGYSGLTATEWQFLVNLDGDLVLEPDYFEKCLARFQKDASLGIAGGSLYHHAGGRRVIEDCPRDHVRGATKIYQRACWEAIGGLAKVPGWDTLDEIKAEMAGWAVRSFPEIMALHLRPTGGAGGGWRDAVKNGRSDYFLGYHPLFMLAKCLRRLFVRPYGVNAVGHLRGYLGEYLKRCPQLDDKDVVRYLRRRQISRVLFAGESRQ